ncbi:hypothetical protein PMAYCL1PPCAC_10245, partial [Pristionchus mayeri]
MVAPTGSPPNAAMEGLATATKVRPTQSYYVPRPVQESKEKDKPSPKEQKKSPMAQLYTPPHSRPQTQPPSPKLRPLMDIQIERTSLFADPPTSSSKSATSSSSSARTSPDVARKSPELENRKKNSRKSSGEKREDLFPKIISVPSSSSTPSSKSASPPRKGFSNMVLPPPLQHAPKDGCICEREKTHVACKRCGYECTGRLALVCPLHPMQMNLMDLTACPNPICHSVQLYEVAR